MKSVTPDLLHSSFNVTWHRPHATALGPEELLSDSQIFLFCLLLHVFGKFCSIDVFKFNFIKMTDIISVSIQGLHLKARQWSLPMILCALMPLWNSFFEGCSPRTKTLMRLMISNSSLVFLLSLLPFSALLVNLDRLVSRHCVFLRDL